MFGIADVAFPAAVVLITQLMLDTEKQITAAGLLSLLFSMVAYASPLSAMVRTLFPPKLLRFVQARTEHSDVCA